MIEKITNFEECVKQIKQLDEKIYRELDDNNFAEVVILLNKRLAVIGMINQIKKKQELSEGTKEEFRRVFKDSSRIEKKIADMMDNIKGRLKNRRQVRSVNRNIAY